MRRSATNGAVVNIKDVACAIGINCIQKRQRQLRQRDFEFSQRAGAVQGVPLIEYAACPQFRQPQLPGLPFFLNADDRPVMRFAQLAVSAFAALSGFDFDDFSPGGRQAVAVAVAVGERFTEVVKFFQVKVADIRVVDGAGELETVAGTQPDQPDLQMVRLAVEQKMPELGRIVLNLLLHAG